VRGSLPNGGKEGQELSHAAVLLPVYKKEGECFLVFTKRTKLTHHAGDVSFPGGSYEEKDGDLKNTALRESHEEIGLDPKDVRILGKLSEVRTLTSYYLVTPYIGLIPYPYDFKVNEKEVEELIEVPVSALQEKNEGRWVYKGHVIWGVTAMILSDFLSFVSSYDA